MSKRKNLSRTKDPWLLTPGPLTTSIKTKKAMLRDWGSRDNNFIKINTAVRKKLTSLVSSSKSYTTIPMQGSGTFGVEAMITTLTSSKSKLLILINGAYGKRIAKICKNVGINYAIYETSENKIHDPNHVDKILSKDKKISHVVMVHCETTSGILNPIEAISKKAKKYKKYFFIDAMSSFGAIPIDARKINFDALAASANKCLEGIPGVSFVIIRKTILKKFKNNTHSLSLDLYDQWLGLEKNGQWRFTPPTHVIVALHQALKEFDINGGVRGRYKRYKKNCKTLINGMGKMGFTKLLPSSLQAPIIVTFHLPKNKEFHFEKFYNLLAEQGFLIYPGKLTVGETFRIGCIGNINSVVIRKALKAIKITLVKMKIISIF